LHNCRFSSNFTFIYLCLVDRTTAPSMIRYCYDKSRLSVHTSLCPYVCLSVCDAVHCG